MQPSFFAAQNSSTQSLQGLIDAVAAGQGDEAVLTSFTHQQWLGLGPYMQPTVLAQGQVLFHEGSEERTMYLVESGSLTVHFEDESGRVRLAMVGAGSVVGEGAFFSHAPRSATVQAAAPTKVWALSALRFSELSHRQPALALGVAMAVGAIMARRMGNRRRRVAST